MERDLGVDGKIKHMPDLLEVGCVHGWVGSGLE